MDKHTLRLEEATLLRSIDIAHASERYHHAGAVRDHDRAVTLTSRLEEIRTQLDQAGDDCDRPA